MLWIGITGPMGGGKSTVSHLLRQMGYDVLDADQVATKVLSPGSDGEAQVFQTFGEHLRNKNGQLDRRALGRLVFVDAEALRSLEAIIHPRVREEVAAQKRRLAELGRGAAFYDVPLLFEKNMRGDFDEVLVVSANAELRAERVRTRSQLTTQEIEERNARHLPAAVKEAAASAVVRNEGTLAELRDSLRAALTHMRVPPAALPPST